MWTMATVWPANAVLSDDSPNRKGLAWKYHTEVDRGLDRKCGSQTRLPTNPLKSLGRDKLYISGDARNPFAMTLN
jgi:hypothetical protein